MAANKQVKKILAAVDELMPAPKLLVGAESPSWQPGRQDGQWRLKLPVEIGGEQLGQYLLIDAYPNKPTMEFSIGIMACDAIVCRLDFGELLKHGNNFSKFAGDLPTLVEGPHWHAWELNKDAIKATGVFHPLPIAAPFSEARQFDATLRWYCSARNIEIGHHGISLPSKTGLF